MKKYYGLKNYKDIPQSLKNMLYKLGWRRIPQTAKPEYIDLLNGRMAYVTSKGKLKERKRGIDGAGYSTTKLKQTDGSFKSYRVHDIVMSFIPNPEQKPFGHHKDHNRQNNSIYNIEPATPKENANK